MNREEEKSAKITRRLQEELADAQAAPIGHARLATHTEVLARLNLATRDLTVEQRGLASESRIQSCRRRRCSGPGVRGRSSPGG